MSSRDRRSRTQGEGGAWRTSRSFWTRVYGEVVAEGMKDGRGGVRESQGRGEVGGRLGRRRRWGILRSRPLKKMCLDS